MKEANFKETEIGKIPLDWEVPQLGNYITLKNGYAFKSEYFSNEGPIVMTPGNFHLDGGLKFTPRNTIHFSGTVSENMKFEKGDLLMVMTDLTPSCNLLGKTGIVNTNEILLHNQRIGKIIFSKEKIATKFLYYFFNSSIFSNRMKSTATGSTVRHTSVPTIKNSFFPLPPLAEQEKIAEVLSDTDLWIESTEALLAKKRLLKKGAMQKLLSPKEDWEVRKLGEVCEITMGQSPPSSFYNTAGIGLPLIQGNADIDNRKTIKRNFSSTYTKIGKKGDIIMSVRAPVGEIATATFECCLGRGVCGIRYPNLFIYHQLIFLENSWSKFSTGSTFDSVNSQQVKELEIQFPPLEKQQEIAEILSSMDLEIESLENRLQKARQLKQGMMQDLLTGKVRLV